MNILQINASARQEGANSTRIADALIARLQAAAQQGFAEAEIAALA